MQGKRGFSAVDPPSWLLPSHLFGPANDETEPFGSINVDGSYSWGEQQHRYPDAASRHDRRKALIPNDKNVADASCSQFQDRTERFGSQLFVIGNGNKADPFRGGPSDANFHYGTPLDGHDFEIWSI
ncbi:hypothetical protein LB553_11060 [Mesorhizobium sp. CA8]|uniref:hypothetical protein n=1 Tax=Mesorhizobium sp. CA8 TaxID=2876637 RepID=UPI001CCE852E|nr:hypothetical protein [Mesorhizobium sp. CA8]MBZ9761415.1 hypothetical protein [Mesorhizobium sp. CA8]